MVSSAGCDGIAVEMIKHAPETIDKKIVNTFNNMAETADISGRQGLLKPFQKSGKIKGPQSNLRSITMLSAKRAAHH